MNSQLTALTEENDQLKASLKEAEQNFEIVQVDNKDLKELKTKLTEEIKNYKDDIFSLEDKLQKLEDQSSQLSSKLTSANESLYDLKKELSDKNNEITSLQALLNKLNKNMNKENRRKSNASTNGDVLDANNDNDWNSGDSVNNNSNSEEDMQDIVRMQIALTNSELEKKQLQTKYETLDAEVQQLKNDIVSTRDENKRLKEEIENASKEKVKAVMELEVLSKYYKEKELEYGKEIGVQQLKRQQREEDADSLGSKLEVTTEENELLKGQVKSIKKELEDTERRYKSQLNQLEKQSHENWIAARNAERKFEESKAEAAALRQTLTMSVKSPPPGDLSSYLDETNASMSSLPDALNSSLPLLPPPPPPPLPMMGSLMGPLLGQTAPMFNDRLSMDAANSAPSWNPPGLATSSSGHNLYQPAVSQPTSLDSYANQQQQQSAPNQQGYSSQQYQQAQPPSTLSYSGYAPNQLNHSFNQWTDLSRDAYSPMSQRSAHTPVTTNSGQMVTSPQQQYSQQSYGASAYNAVASQQPVQSNDAYGNYGQQQAAPQQQPYPNAMPYASWNNSSSSDHNHHQQHHNAYQYQSPNAGGQHHQQQPSQESGSRPASVHTQMV